MQDSEAGGVGRKTENAQAKPEPWPGVVAFSVFMVCVTAVVVAWIVWG